MLSVVLEACSAYSRGLASHRPAAWFRNFVHEAICSAVLAAIDVDCPHISNTPWRSLTGEPPWGCGADSSPLRARWKKRARA